MNFIPSGSTLAALKGFSANGISGEYLPQGPDSTTTWRGTMTRQDEVAIPGLAHPIRRLGAASVESFFQGIELLFKRWRGESMGMSLEEKGDKRCGSFTLS